MVLFLIDIVQYMSFSGLSDMLNIEQCTFGLTGWFAFGLTQSEELGLPAVMAAAFCVGLV